MHDFLDSGRILELLDVTDTERTYKLHTGHDWNPDLFAHATRGTHRVSFVFYY